MFIYKFMGGLVDAITGEQGDDSFDPHEKRKVEKPTTYGETMTHMLKGSIGAGILAMPDAIKGVGLIYGVLGSIVIGMFACYCLQLLIRAQYQICKKWRRGYMAYPKSMKLAIQDGPKFMRWSGGMFYVLVDSMLVVWQLGICSIYFVFVGVNVAQVLEYYGYVTNIRIMIVCELPLQILLNMVKNLKLLTPMSSFSNCLTLFALLMVFFYLIEDDVHIDDEKLKIKSLASIPSFLGTTLFALEAVGVVLALEYNMEKPSRFTGLFGLMSVGFTIIVSLFVLLGSAGYLKYGEDVKASVTLNLPQNEKKAQIARLAYAVALYFSIPLQNFVAYEILLRKLKKRLKPENLNLCDYLLRVILVVIPFAFAVAAPKLGPFISLLGALCLSLVAIMFPAIMDCCVWYPDKYGFLKYKLYRDIIIIVLSLFCLISGVYTSLLEFAANDESDVSPTTPKGL